jgi:hypothetical protein
MVDGANITRNQNFNSKIIKDILGVSKEILPYMYAPTIVPKIISKGYEAVNGKKEEEANKALASSDISSAANPSSQASVSPDTGKDVDWEGRGKVFEPSSYPEIDDDEIRKLLDGKSTVKTVQTQKIPEKLGYDIRFPVENAVYNRNTAIKIQNEAAKASLLGLGTPIYNMAKDELQGLNAALINRKIFFEPNEPAKEITTETTQSADLTDAKLRYFSNVVDEKWKRTVAQTNMENAPKSIVSTYIDGQKSDVAAEYDRDGKRLWEVAPFTSYRYVTVTSPELEFGLVDGDGRQAYRREFGEEATEEKVIARLKNAGIIFNKIGDSSNGFHGASINVAQGLHDSSTALGRFAMDFIRRWSMNPSHANIERMADAYQNYRKVKETATNSRDTELNSLLD